MLRVPTATIDLDGLTLQRDGVEHVLTAQEAALLRYLGERDGPVARQELLTEVWGYAPRVVTRAIDATVSRLRVKLEPNPRKPVSLVSVRGKGYRLHVVASPPVPAAPSATAAPRTLVLGRQEEWASARALLDAGGVVQLVGPGGAGKTTLARALSEERGGHFVDLSACRTVAEVPTAVAHALRLPLSRDAAEGTWKRIAHVLAQAPALLVLDNLEQLPDAVADLIRRLWETTRAPLVLTSRRSVMSEAPVLGVGSLDPVAARALLERSARRVAPSWSPAHEELLDELATAVDCLPLALELVGARLPALGAAALLPRIRQLLHVGDGRAGRHASLSRTVAWSWEMLAPVDRRRLAWWSTFRGAVPAEAALATAPRDAGARWGDEPSPAATDPFDTMLRLQDASLLDPSRAGGLRLWVAVRAFAAERLSDAGERSDAEDAHADWLAAQLPDAPGLLGGRARDDLEQWVVEHRADLSAAVERLAARRPDTALRLALALMAAGRRLVRGDAERVEALLGTVVGRCDDPVLQIRAHLATMRMRRHQARDARTDGPLRQARALLDGLPDAVDATPLEAAWQHLRGNRLRRDGHVDQAIEVYEQSRALAMRCGDRFRLALVDHDIGAALRRLGRAEEAYPVLMRCLANHRAQGNTRYEALALQSLASTRRLQGHVDDALRLGEEAIASARASGDPFALAESLANHGAALTHQGRIDDAGAALSEALDLQRSLGSEVALSFALGNLGAVREQQGDLIEAEMLVQEALARATSAGVPYAAAFWTLRLGQLAHGRGDVAGAYPTYEAAIEALDQQQAWPHLGYAYAFAAMAAAELGRADDARAHLAGTERLRDEGGLSLQVAAVSAALVARHLGAAEDVVRGRFQELGGDEALLAAEPLLRPLLGLWLRAGLG